MSVSRDLALGLDCSTQSITVVAIRCDDEEVEWHDSINFDAAFPQYGTKWGHHSKNSPDGGVEATAPVRMWIDALAVALRRCSDAGILARVVNISVSAQQHATILVQCIDGLTRACRQSSLDIDAACGALAAPESHIWIDSSTEPDRLQISEALLHAHPSLSVYGETGSDLELRFCACQLRAAERRSPGLVTSRTARIHLLSSFLTSLLAGTDAPVDLGDASGTNLNTVLTPFEWSSVMLDAVAIGVAQRLPAIARPGTRIGNVAPWVLALGAQSAATVTIGTGDNPATLVGVGACGPGAVCVSLGTSDTAISALSQEVGTVSQVVPRVLRGLCVRPHIMGNPMPINTARPWFSLACLTKTGGAIAREQLMRSFAGNWLEAEATLRGRLADPCAWAEVECSATHIMRRLSARDDQGSLITRVSAGLDLREGQTECTIAAFLVTCVLQIASLKHSLASSEEVRDVYVVGGGSQSAVIRTIVAAVFNVARVRRAQQASIAAAFGAARVANAASVLQPRIGDCARTDTREAEGAAWCELSEVCAARLRAIVQLVDA
jgi:sugar (pentulose or hexulose) kinase